MVSSAITRARERHRLRLMYYQRCKWGIPFLASGVAVGMVILGIYIDNLFMIIFFGILMVLFGFGVLYHWYHDIEMALCGSQSSNLSDNGTNINQQQTTIPLETLSVPALPTSTTQMDDPPPDYHEVVGNSKKIEQVRGDSSEVLQYFPAEASSSQSRDPKNKGSLYGLEYSSSYPTAPRDVANLHHPGSSSSPPIYLVENEPPYTRGNSNRPKDPTQKKSPYGAVASSFEPPNSVLTDKPPYPPPSYSSSNPSAPEERLPSSFSQDEPSAPPVYYRY